MAEFNNENVQELQMQEPIQAQQLQQLVPIEDRLEQVKAANPKFPNNLAGASEMLTKIASTMMKHKGKVALGLLALTKGNIAMTGLLMGGAFIMNKMGQNKTQAKEQAEDLSKQQDQESLRSIQGGLRLFGADKQTIANFGKAWDIMPADEKAAVTESLNAAKDVWADNQANQTKDLFNKFAGINEATLVDGKAKDLPVVEPEPEALSIEETSVDVIAPDAEDVVDPTQKLIVEGKAREYNDDLSDDSPHLQGHLDQLNPEANNIKAVVIDPTTYSVEELMPLSGDIPNCTGEEQALTPETTLEMSA